ncbi:MAG: hypothetical protein KDB46_13260, partial [Solirubrobacterales bacterium]|nr:hypothetical protein [Solirubrobacterales bacterium]
KPIGIDTGAGTVTIAFPPGSAFNLRKADDKDNRVVVGEALLAVLGAPLRPVYAMLDSEPGPAAEPTGGDGTPVSNENELVERFIAEFDAEVVVDDEPDQPMEETS